MSQDQRIHWDEAYRTRGSTGVSWFQSEPATSLELIDALGVRASSAVIDVGGGTSPLVDRLVERGFTDLSVLDISGNALDEARRRIGVHADVRWIHQDVLTWHPERRFGLWHDRAVFHFLTDAADRLTYLDALIAGIEPGGAVIIATFAEDGPESCSGLPVARYSADDLLAVLGANFVAVQQIREVHVTPAGVSQPFNWLAARIAGAHDA